MARKKKEVDADLIATAPDIAEQIQAQKPVQPKRSYADQFARERRVKLLSKSRGDELVALLKLSGLTFRERGNKEMRMITLEPKAVVIDLTK